MIPRITKYDIRFVVKNFDKDGWMFNPSNAQLERINKIVKKGYIKWLFHRVHEKYGFCALGVLRQAVMSRELSTLLGTRIVALVSLVGG